MSKGRKGQRTPRARAKMLGRLAEVKADRVIKGHEIAELERQLRAERERPAGLPLTAEEIQRALHPDPLAWDAAKAREHASVEELIAEEIGQLEDLAGLLGDSYGRLWPDDDRGEAQHVLFIYDADGQVSRTGLDVSFRTLISVSMAAKTRGFSCWIAPEILRAADPDGHHRVFGGWRCVRERDGQQEVYVRLAVGLQSREGEKMAALVDATPATWEALVGESPLTSEAVIADTPGAFRLTEGLMAPPRPTLADMPIWAGARAFEGVWRTASHFAQLGYRAIDTGQDVASFYPSNDVALGRAVVSYSVMALRSLYSATEVLMDPDQLMALPDFESWDDLMFQAREAQLPFDSIFLDMEGPARGRVIIPMFDLTSHTKPVVALAGVHVSTVKGLLTMTLYGQIQDADMKPLGHPRNAYAPMGMVAFDPNVTPAPHGLWTTQVVGDNGLVARQMTCDAGILTGGERPSGMLLFTLQDADPSVCNEFSQPPASDGSDLDSESVTLFRLSANGVLEGAKMALKALWLLEMSNVEIVDAPISRQVRRQAERKDGRIAMSVHIRTNRKLYLDREGDTGEQRHIEFTHRFRVRGHTKHYPIGTRMADSRPDKMRPCARCGNCRRIYQPAFIKGPEGAPLLLKSLRRD